jgi:hypothetical protein
MAAVLGRLALNANSHEAAAKFGSTQALHGNGVAPTVCNFFPQLSGSSLASQFFNYRYQDRFYCY